MYICIYVSLHTYYIIWEYVSGTHITFCINRYVFIHIKYVFSGAKTPRGFQLAGIFCIFQKSLPPSNTPASPPLHFLLFLSFLL